MKRFILFVVICAVNIAAFAADKSLSVKTIAGTMDRVFLEQVIQDIQNAENLHEIERLKYLGIAWHNLSTTKVRGASKQAYRLLKQVFESSAADYEVMAYYGGIVGQSSASGS